MMSATYVLPIKLDSTSLKVSCMSNSLDMNAPDSIYKIKISF